MKPNTTNKIRILAALGWGWLAGMGFWTLFWGVMLLADHPVEGILDLPLLLLYVAAVQTVLMLPGAAVFSAWYALVPPARSNWGSAILLGLLTGPAVLVGIEMLTDGPRGILETRAWLFGAFTWPVSLTTFLRGAWYRRTETSAECVTADRS